MQSGEFQDVVIKELSEIKANLKEHMRRTAIAEGRIGSLEKFAHMSLGAISLMTFIAASAGLYVLFR